MKRLSDLLPIDFKVSINTDRNQKRIYSQLSGTVSILKGIPTKYDEFMRLRGNRREPGFERQPEAGVLSCCNCRTTLLAGAV